MYENFYKNLQIAINIIYYSINHKVVKCHVDVLSVGYILEFLEIANDNF